jgi:hypothetical protein
LLAGIVPDEEGNLATGVRIESVAGEQCICTRSTLTRIRHPGEAAGVSRDEAFGRDAVGRSHDAVVGRDTGKCLATLPEHEIDRRAVDTLQAQFLADRVLAAWSRPVARLDPDTRERLVIEHPALEHPRDRSVDELHAIAGPRQTPSHFFD